VLLCLLRDGNSNFDAKQANGGEKVVTPQKFAKFLENPDLRGKSALICDTRRQITKTIRTGEFRLILRQNHARG
jgi:hypothetical protein